MVIQNPMKVKYIKLLNAEELVAKVVEETDTILEIKETIEKDIKPDESEDCDTCSYVGTRIELEN